MTYNNHADTTKQIDDLLSNPLTKAAPQGVNDGRNTQYNRIITSTIQSTPRQDVDISSSNALDIFPLLLAGGDLISPYWSQRRDSDLNGFWRQSNHVSSAFGMFISKIATIPFHVTARNPLNQRDVREAKALTVMLKSLTNFGKGWYDFISQLVLSYISQDNGTFFEVIGQTQPLIDPLTGRLIHPHATMLPRKGLPLSLSTLEPKRCSRTRNPIFPVRYQDINGSWFKLHYTRVQFASSLPSTNVLLNGVGFCALSRMVETAQHLTDIQTYESEKLGSRPPRQAIIGESGITGKEIASAFATAYASDTNQNLNRFSKTVVVGGKVRPQASNPISISMMDLSGVPDGFNKPDDVSLGMALISLALSVDPNVLWPLSVAATRSESLVQHVAGQGCGLGQMINVIKAMLGGDESADVLGKPIPSKFQLDFGFQDDLADQHRANIRDIRSTTRARDLKAGTTTTRVTHEQQLEEQEVTVDQFALLELEQGRLPSGLPLRTLFQSEDSQYLEWWGVFTTSVAELYNQSKESIQPQIQKVRTQIDTDIMANSTSTIMIKKATPAYFALDSLEDFYIMKERDELEIASAEARNDPNASRGPGSGPRRTDPIPKPGNDPQPQKNPVGGQSSRQGQNS